MTFSACTNVTAELFKKIGITPDLQVMDIATMIQRRTSMEPVAHGGWSVFVAYGESAQFSNPSTHIALRADGKAAFPGWPTNAKLIDLRRALLSASGDDRRKIADEIEREAYVSIPYVPLGQIKQPTVYRTSRSGILTMGIPVFWNLEKA